jgi:hypothetical protein
MKQLHSAGCKANIRWNCWATEPLKMQSSLMTGWCGGTSRLSSARSRLRRRGAFQCSEGCAYSCSDAIRTTNSGHNTNSGYQYRYASQWRTVLSTNYHSTEEWRLLGCYAVWLLPRTDVSEELSTSIIRVTRIGEIGTTLAVTSNRRTLQR